MTATAFLFECEHHSAAATRLYKVRIASNRQLAIRQLIHPWALYTLPATQ